MSYGGGIYTKRVHEIFYSFTNRKVVFLLERIYLLIGSSRVKRVIRHMVKRGQSWISTVVRKT